MELVQIEGHIWRVPFIIAIYVKDLEKVRALFLEYEDDTTRVILKDAFPYYPSTAKFSKPGRNFKYFTSKRVEIIVEAIDEVVEEEKRNREAMVCPPAPHVESAEAHSSSLTLVSPPPADLLVNPATLLSLLAKLEVNPKKASKGERKAKICCK